MMTQLSGSLTGIGLSALLHFLADVRGSGQLLITGTGGMHGMLFMQDGALASAAFEHERGMPALEAIALALGGGDFEFHDAVEPVTHDLGLRRQEIAGRLEQLAREHAALVAVVPDLHAAPRLAIDDAAEAPTVVLDRDDLRLLLSIDGARTVRQLASSFGLVRTLRMLARLAEMRLVRLDTPPLAQAAAVPSEAARPRPATPAPRPQPAQQPSQQPSQQSSQPPSAETNRPSKPAAPSWSRWRWPSADAS